METVWRIFVECIGKTAKMFGIETYCFVLMSNHFHWLVQTPKCNLGLAMRYFMTESSRRIARASGRINKIYGARYKWSVISHPAYFANSVRYYYQNPVRAGICMLVEDYPWSTLHLSCPIRLAEAGRLGQSIPQREDERLAWFNTIPDSKYSEVMAKALRRAYFEYPPHPSTKRLLAQDAYLRTEDFDAVGGEKSTGTEIAIP